MTSDLERNRRQLSRLSLTIVLTSLAFSVLLGSWLLLRMESALAAQGSSLLFLFVASLTNSAPSTFYISGLLEHLAPWSTFGTLSWANSLLFLIPVAILGAYSARARHFGFRFPRAMWPASLPAIFALALFPMKLGGTIKSFIALSDHGLNNPAAVANGLGQATAVLALGGVISCLCLLAMLWSSARAESLVDVKPA